MNNPLHLTVDAPALTHLKSFCRKISKPEIQRQRTSAEEIRSAKNFASQGLGGIHIQLQLEEVHQRHLTTVFVSLLQQPIPP